MSLAVRSIPEYLRHGPRAPLPIGQSMGYLTRHRAVGVARGSTCPYGVNLSTGCASSMSAPLNRQTRLVRARSCRAAGEGSGGRHCSPSCRAQVAPGAPVGLA